ncbi:MAG: Spy/CpxP family protein refolding chaperone [Terracidiphilus sp.]
MGTSKRSITGRGIFGGMRLGVAIAGVLMAGVALAQGPGGEMGANPGFGEHRPPFERAFGAEGEHGRFWNNPKVVEALKLTDDQRKAMDGILMEHREKLIDLRAGLQKAELGMEPLMGQDQPDEGRILAQIDQVAQARAELEKANARFLLALRSKLTPDQWKQVQALRASRGRDGRGWGRDGQGKGGPGQGGQFRRQGPPPLPPPGGPAGGAQSQLDMGVGPDDGPLAGVQQ